MHVKVNGILPSHKSVHFGGRKEQVSPSNHGLPPWEGIAKGCFNRVIKLPHWESNNTNLWHF